MIADEYRRRAVEAEQRSAASPDPDVKAAYAEISAHWRVLAEQREWLEVRYGTMLAADFFRGELSRPPVMQQQQQQQQVQPKNKKE